jgi:hypothetical protein
VLGNIRTHPKNGRKIEAAETGLCPHQGPAGDRGGPNLLGPAQITITEDRIVAMSTEDADCLIPAGWTLLTE